MNLFEEAKEISEELINLQHFFHQNPEIGMELPITAQKVRETLIELEIEFEETIPFGFKAYIGKKSGKKILLRADMDALPITEKTGLPFSSKNEGAMHACGHDFHIAMLLGAAKLLKNHENELDGQVILMFQPGEEGYNGAQTMIDAGVLEPKPDYAVAIHITASEQYPTGIVAISSTNPFASRDKFTVKVKGKGGHGAEPQNSKNPIYGAIKIIEALTDMSNHEIDPSVSSVLTVCQIISGETHNVIPEECLFRGSLRMYDENVRSLILSRMKEIVEGISKAYGMRGELIIDSSLPMLKNNKYFTESVHSWLVNSLNDVYIAPMTDFSSMGSEDFAIISQIVPSCHITIISQSPKGKHYPEHNGRVVFDDKAVVYGAAVYAQVAISYFNN